MLALKTRNVPLVGYVCRIGQQGPQVRTFGRRSFSTRQETLELRRDDAAASKRSRWVPLQDRQLLIREWHDSLRALRSEPMYWVGKSPTSRD
jgi:hypothetical protein